MKLYVELNSKSKYLSTTSTIYKNCVPFFNGHQFLDRMELPVCYNYPLNCQISVLLDNNNIKFSQKNHSENQKILTDFIHFNLPSYKAFFTDASKKYFPQEDKYRVGVAIVDIQTLQYKSFHLATDSSILEAEAFGIFRALQEILLNQDKEAAVFTDSKAVIDRLGSPKFSHKEYSIILDIKLKLDLLKKKGFKIHIIWVPGHRGIKGLEVADALAKEACYLAEITKFYYNQKNLIDPCLAALNDSNHSTLAKWAETPGFLKYKKNTSFISKIDDLEITKGWTRKSITLYLRLLSGNCADIHYLFKIKKRDSERCICGFEKATFEHELWECAQNSVARFQMLDKLEELGFTATITLPDLSYNPESQRSSKFYSTTATKLI